MLGGENNYDGKVFILNLAEEGSERVWDHDYNAEGKLEKIRYERWGHSATLIGDNVFLFGGYDGPYYNDLQTFNTTTMTLKEWHCFQGQ